MVRAEANAQLHLAASVVVLAAGWLCALDRIEWCLLVLAIASVWITEALNTALERLCDRVSTEFHPLLKQAKDVAAAAVLFAAFGAAAIGALVFGPHLAQFTR
jgi:diacylglycerol kinase (ATP)